jgi:cobalt-zinc-cadmium efflux system membrane fusion protein
MEQNRKWFGGGAAALALVLAGAWWVVRPSGAPASAEANEAPQKRPTARAGVIAMDEAQIGKLGIASIVATAAGSAPLATLPAVIVPPPNARVAVAATFPGVVTRTMVVEGQAVRRGQALAVIASRDVLMLGAELARTRARLGLAQSNAGRLGQLSREGVIAGSRADEARATLREAQVDVSEKGRILAHANASGNAGTYTLVAPIAGRVTTATAQAGSPVDGTTAPYVIDAAERYEVEAQLPERLLGTVRPGMEIKLEGGVSGMVTSVGATIDPATRSVKLKANVGAVAGVASGKATTVTVFGPVPAGAVAVPASAVTTMNGSDVAFVRTAGGFAARRVVKGGGHDGSVVILSGLSVGDRVVTAGTSELKSLAGAQ